MDRDTSVESSRDGKSQRRGGAWLIPAVLVTCTGVSILSTDLYLPSLPHLPELLKTDTTTVQLTLSLNIAAYAVAQLLHGPLSDRFGRRFLLLLGLSGFFLMSLVCALAGSIEMLILGRIGQGLTASAGSVVILLIIRDLYQGSKAMQVMAAYGVALGLVPAVGPLIGGLVFVEFGWQANFFLLSAAIVIVLLLVARFVPETGERNPQALRPRAMLVAYVGLLRNRGYLRYYLPLTFTFGALFAFLNEGTFLVITRFGVATEAYGLYHAIIVVAYMAGSLTVGRLADRVQPADFVRLAMASGAAGAVVLLLPLLLGHESLWLVMGGMALYSVSLGFILASGPMCMLAAVDDGPKGSASALVGASQMGAGALAGFIVAFTHDGSAMPMAATIAGFLALAVLGYRLCSPR